MADNRILEDGLRGALAGIRGVIEAKVMTHQARTEREKRISDQAYRQQMANLDERRVRISELSQEDQSATLALKQQSEKDAAAAEKAEQERVSKLQAKYDEIAAKITEIDTRYEAAEDDTEKQQIAGERRVAQNELSILGTQLKYTQPKEAAMPKPTTEAQWKTDTQFIQEREDSGEITAEDAKKARELVLGKLLGVSINDSENPLELFVAQRAAIRAAIADGTITEEQGNRRLAAIEAEAFPEDENKVLKEAQDVYNAKIATGATEAEAKAAQQAVIDKAAGIESTENKVLKAAEDVYNAKIAIGEPEEAAIAARNATINEAAGDTEDDNKVLKAAQDVYDAEIATGSTEEAAAAARKSVVAEASESGKLTEKQELMKSASEIQDKDKRAITLSIATKGLSRSALYPSLTAMTIFAKDGNDEGFYSAVSDILDQTDKTKTAPTRYGTAKAFHNMQMQLDRLKSAGIVEGDRVLRATVIKETQRGQGLGSILRLELDETLTESIDQQNLTDVQQQVYTEVLAYLQRTFVEELKRISGSAVVQSEEARSEPLYPDVGIPTVLNSAIIQATIQKMYDDQYAYYDQELPNIKEYDLVERILETDNWNEMVNTTAKKANDFYESMKSEGDE